MKGSLVFLLLVSQICQGLAPVAALASQVGYVSDNNRAVELLKKGDYFHGIEQFKQAQLQNPYDETVHNNLRNAYLTAGSALAEQQNFAPLVELMREAQQFDDTAREFWLLRGYALLQLERYDEAEVDLQEARSMGEPDAQLLFLLAQVCYATDRLQEALDTLESATLVDPQQHEIQQMFAKVRRELAVEQRMEKEYGGHFVITFDGDENPGLGREVLKSLEDAYNLLGSRLDHYPEQRVTVILYNREQFRDLTRSPDWAGGLYDGKIRLPVGGISGLDEPVKKLLYHEYMHVLLHDMAGNNIPTWLNEGLAQMAERELGSVPQAEEQLSLPENQLFELSALEGSFRGFSGTQAKLAYAQSASFVGFLLEEYGWYRVRDLVVACREMPTAAMAIDRAFGSYGVNYQFLEKHWRGQL